MKRHILSAACVMTFAAVAPGRAQTVLDLSLITCGQLLASDAERQVLIGSWMSGYFSASKNLNMLDFNYVARNRRVVGAYCKTHKSDTVMSAMQKKWH